MRRREPREDTGGAFGVPGRVEKREDASELSGIGRVIRDGEHQPTRSRDVRAVTVALHALGGKRQVHGDGGARDGVRVFASVRRRARDEEPADDDESRLGERRARRGDAARAGSRDVDERGDDAGREGRLRVVRLEHRHLNRHPNLAASVRGGPRSRSGIGTRLGVGIAPHRKLRRRARGLVGGESRLSRRLLRRLELHAQAFIDHTLVSRLGEGGVAIGVRLRRESRLCGGVRRHLELRFGRRELEARLRRRRRRRLQSRTKILVHRRRFRDDGLRSDGLRGGGLCGGGLRGGGVRGGVGGESLVILRVGIRGAEFDFGRAVQELRDHAVHLLLRGDGVVVRRVGVGGARVVRGAGVPAWGPAALRSPLVDACADLLLGADAQAVKDAVARSCRLTRRLTRRGVPELGARLGGARLRGGRLERAGRGQACHRGDAEEE